MDDLINIVNLETAKKGFDYSPEYSSRLDMAYIPGINEKGELVNTLIKGKDESIRYTSDETLEGIVRSVGGSSEEAYDAVQSKYALQKVQQMDQEFVESENYNQLRGWCYKQGIKAPEQPRFYGASNQHEDAVAWTNPEEGILGVNTYIDDKIQRMAGETGLSKGQVKELCITHEYMHQAQNLSKFGDNVYLIESDNELNLAKYFYDTAMNSKDQNTRERYTEMTKVCLGRYLGIMAAYLQQQGIDVELNEDTADQLLEDSGFIEYAKQQPNNQEQPGESDLGDSSEESAGPESSE